MGLITGIIGVITAGAIAVTKALAAVGMAVEGLKVVGNSIASIAKALGIVKPDRKVEDLGDRAMQAEEQGMKPEDYASYEAWVKAIEEDDWGYDPEKNKDISVEEKVLKGVEVSSAATMEKFPEVEVSNFLGLAAKEPEFFTVERMEEIGKIAVEDIDTFTDIVNYVTGDEKNHDIVGNTVDVLMDIEKSITPEISDIEAYAKVASFRQIDE